MPVDFDDIKDVLENGSDVDSDEVSVSPVERTVLGGIGSFFLEFVKVALLAGLTIGLVRYFLFKPFYVKGESMVPNFYEKEYLIVDELSYRFRDPVRGEVVVFRSPVTHDDFYLKRVIGMPGERIKIEDGKIYLYNEFYPQGVEIQEEYIVETTPGTTNITLGQDEYFVMGDNRDASYDSRRFGPIHKDDITGRTFFRGWPLQRITTFGPPTYQFEK